MYSENLKRLTGHQYWLLEHQITAFWHGFGISNGLWNIPEEYVKVERVKGKLVYSINKVFMMEHLKEYVKWLETYKESWNSKDKHPFDVKTFDGFLEQEECHKDTREQILKMISLLQDVNENEL